MHTDLKDLTTAFLKERHALMAYIYAMVRDPHVAEDIFQEVWLRLSGAAERQVDIANLPAWCRGTARNLALHHWRGARNAKVLADSGLLEFVDRAFEEHDPAGQPWQHRREALQRCLQDLPDASRSVIALKYEGGLSVAEIGARLSRSASAVMTSLSRIRRQLLACVERRLAAEAAP